MAMTIEDLIRLDAIRHERVWIVNKGMSDEQVIAASDIKGAYELFLKTRKANAISIERVFDDIIIAAI